ncbi:Phenoloxidase subunit 2 [Nesidiocoris tenuis]|uniref:Phenoloxidase subunit 2 n=1 Tax=Nesidiocoris tenuis TaxID=355587 RepID=A0ABN7BAK2_9HEMI|nr:Phenoloxidase subunit 2 [Nesidiocoris tenuis]
MRSDIRSLGTSAATNSLFVEELKMASSKASSDPRTLLFLFERPTEPVFMPKGDKGAVFDVPDEYLVERYRPLKDDLASRFGTEERIAVKTITLPDLSLPLQLGRRENFSLFLPHHKKMAARLIEIFMGMRTLEDFISASVYCRDRINPYLFIYALSVAILHRPDTQNLPIPSLTETFPEKFMDSAVFAQVKEETNIVEDSGQRIKIEIPVDYTASNLDIEHRLAYFREDLGINLHHWHWHLVYPTDTSQQIVQKDRRGELFYYMHQQVLARYNFERLSNSLGRVKRLNNWRDPIEEGYFPKLDSLVASRVWPPRFANTRLNDIDREQEQIRFDLQDLERWRDRIYAAIHSGSVIDKDGQSVALTESKGIDILGNMIESSTLSVNRNLYGDLHNLGHTAISFCHDPDNKNLEPFGVMGDTATAMRDPVFYRWHAFIDDIFQEHKNTLPRYTVAQLDYPGIAITGVQLVSQGEQPNIFSTFWEKSDVDLSNGLDFNPRGSVYATFTHLQHSTFRIKITIDNKTGADKIGTVRIFMSPKYDERGLSWSFRDQKNMFIEIDKFVVNLKPKQNTVERLSHQSSVTIPFERSFRNLNQAPQSGQELQRYMFCGCGWPHHMLIPKGTADGYPCELFVMVSNWADDKVEGRGDPVCADAASYCGVRDALYPDKRSMGYPFDRQPRAGVQSLQQFLTPNMRVQDVKIRFRNEYRDPEKSGSLPHRN